MPRFLPPCRVRSLCSRFSHTSLPALPRSGQDTPASAITCSPLTCFPSRSCALPRFVSLHCSLSSTRRVAVSLSLAIFPSLSYLNSSHSLTVWWYLSQSLTDSLSLVYSLAVFCSHLPPLLIHTLDVSKGKFPHILSRCLSRTLVVSTLSVTLGPSLSLTCYLCLSFVLSHTQLFSPPL